jgi:hypothetical protein
MTPRENRLHKSSIQGLLAHRRSLNWHQAGKLLGSGLRFQFPLGGAISVLQKLGAGDAAKAHPLVRAVQRSKDVVEENSLACLAEGNSEAYIIQSVYATSPNRDCGYYPLEYNRGTVQRQPLARGDYGLAEMRVNVDRTPPGSNRNQRNKDQKEVPVHKIHP